MNSEIKQRIEQIRRDEVPKGYKKGKLGIVPEEWKEASFSTLFTSTSDYTDDLDKYPLYSLTIEDGITPKTERYERSHLVKKEDSYKIVRPNDYAYNPMNLRFGAVARHKGDMPVAVSGYYDIFTTVFESDLPFMDSFLTCGPMITYYNRVSTGSLVEKQRVHFSQFLEFVLPLPSINERAKIATILTIQDKVIELKEKRLAEKQRQKKYLMQQLLTGKKRLPGFSGKWIRIRIGNSHYTKIDYDSLTNNTNKDFEFEYITLENVNNGFLKETIHCTFETAPSRARRVVHKDDILYGTVRPNLHSHLLAGELLEGMVCSTGFCVIQCNPSHLLPYFLYSAIFLEDIDRQAKRIMSGSNYPAISSSDVKNMKIDIPCNIKEQEAITSVLSVADREIDLLRQDIEQEKQKKKALMQLLLTGIVRVKV